MAVGSAPGTRRGRAGPLQPGRSGPAIAGQVLLETVRACFRHRVTGLAGEAAFFTVLSLPPLIFALTGAVGYVAGRLDSQTLVSFREQVLSLAGRLLTADAVSSVIAPTLDEVLSGGRVSVVSIGFVIAIWSGSRALNVFLDTITIMYGFGGRRSFLHTRGLAFGLYLVFLVLSVVVIPLVLAGPTLVERLLPDDLGGLGRLYWPVVLLASTCFLTTLFHVSVPVRTRWRADLPGAAITLGIWVGGSVLLRLVLNESTGSTSIYGPLAAPIAVLLWLYLTSLAILVGAAFNAALDTVWPRLSGLHEDETSATVEPSAAPPSQGADPRLAE